MNSQRRLHSRWTAVVLLLGCSLPARSQTFARCEHAAGTSCNAATAPSEGEVAGQAVWGGTSATEPSRMPPQIDVRPHRQDALVPSSFDLAYGYTTPAYISAGVPRSLKLLYSSGVAAPTGFVQVDATDDSASPPDKMSISIRDASNTPVRFTNGRTENFYRHGNGANRLAAHWDGAHLSTGSYVYTVTVRSWWGTEFRESTRQMRVLIVNERNSAFGSGWTLVGHQRIYRQDEGIVVTEGDGSAIYFARKCTGSTCTYHAPRGEFTTLVAGAAVQRRAEDGSVAVFDAAGRLSHTTDRLGKRNRYEYDGSGRITAIVDPVGKRTRLHYGARGRLAKIEDPGGRVSLFRSNSAGDVVEIVDPTGTSFLHARYDESHRLTTRWDRAGSAWDHVYDDAGKVRAVTMPTVTADGAAVRPVNRVRSWESALLPSAGSGAFANPSETKSQESARAEVTDPLGNTTRFALDPFGAPTRVERPLGDVQTVERDEHGRPLRIRAFSGEVTEYTYAGTKPATVKAVSTGRITTFTWTLLSDDSTRWSVRVSTPGEADAEYSNISGQWLVTRLGSSRWYYDAFDGFGRPVSTYGPGGHARYTYDPAGAQNLRSITAAVGLDTITTEFTLDTVGRVTQTVASGYAPSSAVYDELNRVLSTTSAAGTTRYRYAPAGWIQQVVDAKNQEYTFSRNALGWLESEADPAGRTTRVGYDAAGRATSETNRRGQTVTFVYDALGRLKERTSHEGKVTRYDSDPAGRWTAVENGESTDTVRTVRGARSSVNQISWRSGRRYVVDTHRDTALSFVETTGDWGYNLVSHFEPKRWAEQISMVHDGVSTVLARDTVENRVLVLLPSGDSIVHAFDGVRYTEPSAGGALDAQPYSRSTAWTAYLLGRRDSTWFGYDDAGRLSSDGIFRDDGTWDMGAEVRHRYGYDDVGNPATEGAVVTDGNRLLEFGGYLLEYDLDGNLTRKLKPGVSDERFAWNSLGELEAMWRVGGDSTAYGYDGMGRRVRKTRNGMTTKYVYDAQHVIAETDGAGNVTRDYTYYAGVDRPHSMRVNGQRYYYVADKEGNVRGLVDSAGQVSNRYAYTPFGALQYSAESVENPFRFAGREWDAESRTYHNRARTYDPELQRFVSEDPLGLEGGINKYVYAGNDPVNRRDPSGLEDCILVTYSVDPKEEWKPATVLGGDGRIITQGPGWTRGCYPEDSSSQPWGSWPSTQTQYGWDPAAELEYIERIRQQAIDEAWAAERHAQIQAAVTSGREVADLGVGFIPGVSTVHDASVVLSGYNAVTGERVGIGGRFIAFAGMVTPASGGQIRGAWKLTKEASGRVFQHSRTGFKYVEHLTTRKGVFWSVDRAGHGGSAWKVFTEEATGLRWYRDADEYGDFLQGKHKGSVGEFIPFKDLKRIEW